MQAVKFKTQNPLIFNMPRLKPICDGSLRERYVYSYKDVRRGLLDFNPSTTGREAFLTWIRKYKYEIYRKAVEKALKAYVTETWSYQNHDILVDVAHTLGEVFHESYANIRIDGIFEKDVLDPTIDVNLVWWYYYVTGASEPTCASFNADYKTINGTTGTLWNASNESTNLFYHDIDITNSSYFLSSSISSDVDQNLNTNVGSGTQSCSYNNSNGYGFYFMKSDSGSITLASNTLMLYNSWTIPSSVSSLTLDTVSFNVGNGNANVSYDVCGGGSSYCCSSLSGDYNPGWCQGYPTAPVFYGTLSSSITVSSGQTITYYLYLI